MKIIYLTAGHQVGKGQDNGAVSAYGNEGQEARKFVTALSNELLKLGVLAYTEDDRLTLANTIAWLGSKVKSSDYTLDIHFNASSNNKATGTEILVPTGRNEKEFALADKLSKIISEKLKIKNRGVKTETESQHSRLGILSNHKLSSANNLLVEVCFISNQSDMNNYRANFESLIKSISTIIKETI